MEKDPLEIALEYAKTTNHLAKAFKKNRKKMGRQDGLKAYGEALELTQAFAFLSVAIELRKMNDREEAKLGKKRKGD